MVKLVVKSTKRSFVTVGLYLSAIAEGIAMSKASRAGKSNTANSTNIRAVADID